MKWDRAAVGGAVLVAVGLAVTARSPDAGVAWRAAFVGVSLGGTVLLVIATRSWRPSVNTVLLGAVLMRLVVFPLPPTLSDDGYRYVWDGAVMAQEGQSPYRWRPSDPELAEHHDDPIYRRLNSPDYYSVYPPVSQAVFAVGGLVYPFGWYVSWLTIKLVLVLAEVAGIWCLLRLVAPSRAALYAWNPLTVIEIAGQGHSEGLLVGFLGLALLALHHRPAWAPAGLALAGAVKLYPFLLIPLTWARSTTKAVVAGLGLAGAVLVPLLVSGDLARMRESLGLYWGTFDYYSAPYLVLKAAAYPLVGEGAGQVAAGALGAIGLSGLLALFLAADGSARSARQALCLGVVVITLTSTTLHPWHWLGLVFVLPLLKSTNPLIWITTTSTATYTQYGGFFPLAVVVWIGWVGALLVALHHHRQPLLHSLMRWRARGKAARVIPYLHHCRPGARLLDLGAGEGYVGGEVGTRLGAAVTGLDVARYGQADNRVDLFDGHRIPFAGDYFDATLLIFVLHHATHPVALLREAVRVTSGPVVILETVCTGSRHKGRLERLDRWLNRLRSSGHIDEDPLDIRSDLEWLYTIEEEGLDLIAHQRWEGVHPQALYVVNGTSYRRSSGVTVRASSQTA